MSVTYTEGRQPCDHYRPQMEANAYAAWENVHECSGPYDASGKVPGGHCDGTVSFCNGCTADHHSGGWDTCGVAVALAAEQGA